MTGVLSKFRLKVPSSQRDDSYSSSQRSDSHGTFHLTRNIPYNKENKGKYYSNINSKVVTSIFDPRLDTATVVVKRNSTRQAINRARLWHFAESRARRIYLFAAQDSRTVSTYNSRLTLRRFIVI